MTTANAAYIKSKDRTKTLRGRFLSFDGRIGRLTFFLRLLAVFIVVVAVYAVNIFLIRALDVYFTFSIILILVLSTFVLTWTVLSFVSILALGARRLHDFNFSSRWVLLFIAFAIAAIFFGFSFVLFWLVTFAVLLALALIPGSKGKNKYGFRNLKAMTATFD